MTKEIIIIAVIILLIYYYYQQNQPHILEDSPETKNLVKDLKRQVQHYQNLYQKRVAHDLDKNSVEIQTDNIGTDNQETQTDFTTQNIGTQTGLTSSQITNLIQQQKQLLKLGLSDEKQSVAELSIKELEKQLEKKYNNQLKERFETERTLTKKLQTQETEITRLEEIIKKQTAQETYFDDKTKKISQLIQENENTRTKYGEWFKKINLLFNPDSSDYEMIDFEELYKLLWQLAMDRERERETKINNDDNINQEFTEWIKMYRQNNSRVPSQEETKKKIKELREKYNNKKK